MRNIRACLASAILTACVFANAAARADDCKPLTLISSIDLTPLGNNQAMLAPVTINNTPKLLLVDTGGFASELTRQTVDELHLPTRHVRLLQYGMSGTYSDQAARAGTFVLGRVEAENIDFMIANDSDIDSKDTDGAIGPAILKYYDVELDFQARKLNLLSQDHCTGKVVYWPANAIAAVPMLVVPSGHIVVPVTLDGVNLQALIDTGAPTSVLTLDHAESNYNLKPGTPDTPRIGSVQGTTDSIMYEHKFKTLSFEGVTISNPDFVIMPDLMRNKVSHDAPLGSRLKDDDEKDGMGDMIIGMNELRHLHIYIAYKEHMLYITPASPEAGNMSAGTMATSASPAP